MLRLFTDINLIIQISVIKIRHSHIIAAKDAELNPDLALVVQNLCITPHITALTLLQDSLVILKLWEPVINPAYSHYSQINVISTLPNPLFLEFNVLHVLEACWCANGVIKDIKTCRGVHLENTFYQGNRLINIGKLLWCHQRVYCWLDFGTSTRTLFSKVC